MNLHFIHRKKHDEQWIESILKIERRDNEHGIAKPM